jgi:hypothetical protein
LATTIPHPTHPDASGCPERLRTVSGAVLPEALDGLTDASAALWLAGRLWLNEHGGDVLPGAVVERLSGGDPEIASTLVRAGLWEDAADEGDYRVVVR